VARVAARAIERGRAGLLRQAPISASIGTAVAGTSTLSLGPGQVSRGLPTLAKQEAIAAPRHGTRIADQPAHPRAERLGALVPIQIDARIAKQDPPNLALACSCPQSIAHPEQGQPARHPRIARKERSGEPVMERKLEESPERKGRRLCAGNTGQPVFEQHLAASDKASGLDIDPDMAPAIRQNGMLTAIGIGGDREPGNKTRNIEMIGSGPVDGDNGHTKCRGVELGMPDDPCVGRFEVGTFGEKARFSRLGVARLRRNSRLRQETGLATRIFSLIKVESCSAMGFLDRSYFNSTSFGETRTFSPNCDWRDQADTRRMRC